MAIPDYESVMLPLLRLASDGLEHRIGDAALALGDEFQLTSEERKQLLPSGKQATFANRVHWARTYLVQAKLIEPTRHAHFRITDRGQQALANKPSKIDNSFLAQFHEFQEFRKGRQSKNESGLSLESGTNVPSATQQTPDELLRTTIKQIDNALKSELLARVLSASPAFFEGLVVELLVGMGFGGSREDAARVVGKSGDGGIDGVIDQDSLGLDRVYIQAKRYAPGNGVSEPEIRAFSGSLGAAKANKGVFVTTSYFTSPAVNFAERHPSRIVLIDGEQLAALMIRHNVGARIDETLYIKKIDEDFFSEE